MLDVILWLSYIVLALCVPLVCGPWAALGLLLLLPLISTCGRSLGKRWLSWVITVELGISCCLVLPKAMILPVSLWCGAAVLITLLPEDKPIWHGMAWAGCCLGTICLVLIGLYACYRGQIVPGLAWSLTNWIGKLDNVQDILFQCYRLGLASLEEELQLYVQLFGRFAIRLDVKNQLLYSLRTTLEDVLTLLLPQALVLWVMLTGVTAAWIPDALRRKHGGKWYIPPFWLWELNDSFRRGLTVFMWMYLLRFLPGSPVIATIGTMCGAVFWDGYVIFGLAVVNGIGIQLAKSKPVRRLWMLGCLLLAPILLVMLGIVAGRIDLRRIHGATKKSKGDEKR